MHLEQFCKSLLLLPFHKSKALANLLIALACNVYHRSVVGLSLQPCYHYQYSSICDAIHSISYSSKATQNTSEDKTEWLVEKNFPYPRVY